MFFILIKKSPTHFKIEKILIIKLVCLKFICKEEKEYRIQKSLIQVQMYQMISKRPSNTLSSVIPTKAKHVLTCKMRYKESKVERINEKVFLTYFGEGNTQSFQALFYVMKRIILKRNVDILEYTSLAETVREVKRLKVKRFAERVFNRL